MSEGVLFQPPAGGSTDCQPREALQAEAGWAVAPGTSTSLCRSSAAREYYRTSQKYAWQTTGLKIRENTFPLLTKVGEDSVSSGITLLAQ